MFRHGSRSRWRSSIYWFSGMASSLMRLGSCPSRWLSLVCKILMAFLGLSETNTIGYIEPKSLPDRALSYTKLGNAPCGVRLRPLSDDHAVLRDCGTGGTHQRGPERFPSPPCGLPSYQA